MLRQIYKVSPQQKVEVSQKIILEQIFELKLRLIQQLHGDNYIPTGDCPHCYHTMTPVEIIKGFNQDPTDFTTSCSKCGHRFRSNLVMRYNNEAVILIPFYCAIQTLDQLKGKESLSPENLKKDYPGIYQSAIIHFGGLRQAFAKNEIKYPYQGIPDWKEKIKPFLGQLKDTVIARTADVSVYTIRKMRKELKIPRCINSGVKY